MRWATSFFAVLLVVWSLASCGGDSRTPLQMAKENCGGPDASAMLGDEGRTLALNGAGQTTGGLEVETIICYLDVLEAPDAVRRRMESTRAIDGPQQGAWGDGLSATWQYHPDDGLDTVIELER